MNKSIMTTRPRGGKLRELEHGRFLSALSGGQKTPHERAAAVRIRCSEVNSQSWPLLWSGCDDQRSSEALDSYIGAGARVPECTGRAPARRGVSRAGRARRLSEPLIAGLRGRARTPADPHFALCTPPARRRSAPATRLRRCAALAWRVRALRLVANRIALRMVPAVRATPKGGAACR
jgi:hypothetical protein